MEIQLTKKFKLTDNSRPYIIAELGSNHNGDMELAKKLIDSAKSAGADCVKFQSWSKNTIFSKSNFKDNYFLTDDYRHRDDFTLEEIVEKFSISESQLIEMRNYAEKIDIDFTSTPFSKKEVDFLCDELKTDFIKIASMDLNNFQFLDYIARKKKPIVISTGLSSLDEINQAIETIEAAGNNNIVILHCVAIYPPADEIINLNNIDTLRKLYPYPIGFSDHSLGTCITLGAIAKEARIVEKHFTLDKEMFGWDHKVSADENDMKIIVDGAKRIQSALGSERIKRVEDEERLNSFRRSVVASKAIKKGTKITLEMLEFKRPGKGLPPESIKYMLNKEIKRDLEYDEIIKLEDF